MLLTSNIRKDTKDHTMSVFVKRDRPTRRPKAKSANTLKRFKPIRRISKARAKQRREYEQVKFDFLEDNEVCFVCKKFVPILLRECHHFYKRRGKLLAWREGFRVAHPICHQSIHNNEPLARELGFLAPKECCDDFARAQEHFHRQQQLI